MVNGKRGRGRKRCVWLGKVSRYAGMNINRCTEIATNREEWRPYYPTSCPSRNSGKVGKSPLASGIVTSPLSHARGDNPGQSKRVGGTLGFGQQSPRRDNSTQIRRGMVRYSSKRTA